MSGLGTSADEGTRFSNKKPNLMPELEHTGTSADKDIIFAQKQAKLMKLLLGPELDHLDTCEDRPLPFTYIKRAEVARELDHLDHEEAEKLLKFLSEFALVRVVKDKNELIIINALNHTFLSVDINNPMSFKIDNCTETLSERRYIRTLISLEYVRVKNINGELGKLYGTVIVTDFWDDHTVYHRSLDNYESKRPGEDISLTWPSYGIWALDAVTIDVSLFSSPDNEIARGEIAWDPRVSPPGELLEEEVSGEYGSVTVGYLVIEKAILATVKVVLINGNRELLACVYGNIKASIDLRGSQVTWMLFEKSKNEYEKVGPQQAITIPLTRPAFPVSVESDLTINVDLKIDDWFAPNNAFIMQFTPKNGIQRKDIPLDFGVVKVSVTFY